MNERSAQINGLLDALVRKTSSGSLTWQERSTRAVSARAYEAGTKAGTVTLTYQAHQNAYQLKVRDTSGTIILELNTEMMGPIDLNYEALTYLWDLAEESATRPDPKLDQFIEALIE